MKVNGYTTAEAAAEIGVTASRIRQLVLSDGFIEGEHYNRFGRDLLITTAGLKAAKDRITKPGPVPKPKAAKKAKR